MKAVGEKSDNRVIVPKMRVEVLRSERGASDALKRDCLDLSGEPNVTLFAPN